VELGACTGQAMSRLSAAFNRRLSRTDERGSAGVHVMHSGLVRAACTTLRCSLRVSILMRIMLNPCRPRPAAEPELHEAGGLHRAVL
jgi:hypothetical protein